MNKFGKLEILSITLIVITLFNTSLAENLNSTLIVSTIIALTTMFKGVMIIDHFMEQKEGNKILKLMMRAYFFVFPMLIIITLFV